MYTNLKGLFLKRLTLIFGTPLFTELTNINSDETFLKAEIK